MEMTDWQPTYVWMKFLGNTRAGVTHLWVTEIVMLFKDMNLNIMLYWVHVKKSKRLPKTEAQTNRVTEERGEPVVEAKAEQLWEREWTVTVRHTHESYSRKQSEYSSLIDIVQIPREMAWKEMLVAFINIRRFWWFDGFENRDKIRICKTKVAF